MMMTYEDGINRSRFAGGSVELILAPLALGYVLFPDPIFLLVVQTLFIGTGLIFAGLIAKHVAPDNGFVLLASLLLYSCHTPLHFVNIFDFHAYGLLIPGAFMLIYFLLKERWILYGFSLVYLCCVRNDLALYSLPLCLFLLLKKKWSQAIISFVFCVGFYIAMTDYFSPLFGEVPQHYEKYVHHRFLGQTTSGILITIVSHPIDTFLMLFSSPEKLQNMLRLFWVTGFIPLIVGFEILFLASPFFLLYFLPPSTIFTEPYHQYNASMVPFILSAAILGMARLGRLCSENGVVSMNVLAWLRHKFFIPIFVISACILGYSKFNLRVDNAYRHFRKDILRKYQNHYEHYKDVDEMISYIKQKVPNEAKLGAISYLGPHLANREYIFLIPRQMDGLDYLLVHIFPLGNKIAPQDEIVQQTLITLKQRSYVVEKYLPGIILLKKVAVVSDSMRKNNLDFVEHVKSDLKQFLDKESK